MTKELEIKLVLKYPKILKNYGGDKMATCMHWGMEHGDGWYDILDKGMEKIQYFCDRCESGAQLIADQIKEKYGTLSFYYTTENTNKIEYSILESLVSSMENASAHTCEESGKPGYMCQRGGWFKTLSYEEARKAGYKAADEGNEAYWEDLDKKKEATAQISSAS